MTRQLFKLILIAFFPIALTAQESIFPEAPGYFSALIVTDIDSSIAWYKNTFGLTVRNHDKVADMGFAQANLRRGDMWVELIELNSSINPKDVVEDFSGRTKMIGIFKSGFFVNNFDAWVKYLKPAESDIVTDKLSGKKMFIIKDPDGNRIQVFEK